MIWSALILRSESGFSVMNMRPWLADVFRGEPDYGFNSRIFHHQGYELRHLFFHRGE